MNIIKAIKDENLFRPFLQDRDGEISSWSRWTTALRVLYGLPIRPEKYSLIKKCTGRDIKSLPKNGFITALLLVGRRGGKSKISGLVAAFEAALSGREKQLSKGEMGLVSVISPTRLQSQIIKKYVRAAFETDLLQQEIVQEDRDGFELSNGIRIQILVGDFRSVRGFTQLAVIVDEICFMGLTEESKVKNDSELIQAIRPALATTGGKLIAISTKYAKKGWAYRTWKTNFGNDMGKILVWDAESKLMNPTLSQEIIDEAIAEDSIAARTEFLNQWRDDICAYLPREVVETVVAKGRKELLPKQKISYFAFVDISGGRSDDSALAIAHRDKKVVIDFLKGYRPPHSPYEVIASMADEMRRFGIHSCTGDNYSAEFCSTAFEQNGIHYTKSSLPKSGLYLEFLPVLCSDGIELLDDEVLISQIAALERRTRSGGKDIIDHPQGGHDDVANVAAGICYLAGRKKYPIGVF